MFKFAMNNKNMKVNVMLLALTCLWASVSTAHAGSPNNNSDTGSFKSNFTTSTQSQPQATSGAKTLNRTGQSVVTDPSKNQPVMTGTQGLPESQILLHHDDVAPGLNRQQAMELEAQNGKLPPYVEQEMKSKGLLKDAKSPAKEPVSRAHR